MTILDIRSSNNILFQYKNFLTGTYICHAVSFTSLLQYWTGTDNQKRPVNFNPTGNVTAFFVSQVKGNIRVVETSSNEGNHFVPYWTAWQMSMNNWQLGHFFSDLCHGKQRLNNQACEVDHMYLSFWWVVWWSFLYNFNSCGLTSN